MPRPKQRDYRRKKAMIAAIDSSIASTSTNGYHVTPAIPTNLKISRSGHNRHGRTGQASGHLNGSTAKSVSGRHQRNGGSSSASVSYHAVLDQDNAEYEEDETYDDEWYGYEEEENVEGHEEAEEEEEYQQEEEQEVSTPSRKKKRKEKDDGSGRGVPILPVAELPEDWDGEVLDGPTYLALAARSNKALPAFTRAHNPYRRPSPSRSIQDSESPVNDGEDENMMTSNVSVSLSKGTAQVVTARHPALPKESWTILFSLHFAAYKKSITENWPPSPPLPYPSDYPPVPASATSTNWGHFINGYPRLKVKSANGGVDEEEEAMNVSEEMEPLSEKHQPREPRMSVLQKLSTDEILSILSGLTHQISTALTPLEENLIPSESEDAGTHHDQDPNRPQSHTRKNPFSERYSQWIYALLLVLEPLLDGNQVYRLREMAKVIMRVGGWRWIVAVTCGEVGLPSSAGETEIGIGEENITPWVFGARWKYLRDRADASGEALMESAKPAKDQTSPRRREGYVETGVDETLARCWMIVYAVAVGWGQGDLAAELETMFS